MNAIDALRRKRCKPAIDISPIIKKASTYSQSHGQTHTIANRTQTNDRNKYTPYKYFSRPRNRTWIICMQPSIVTFCHSCSSIGLQVKKCQYTVNCVGHFDFLPTQENVGWQQSIYYLHLVRCNTLVPSRFAWCLYILICWSVSREPTDQHILSDWQRATFSYFLKFVT